MHTTIPDTHHRCGVLYDTDTVVRTEAVETIRKMAEKVAEVAHEAKQGPLDNPEHTDKLEAALDQTLSLVWGLHTALSIAQGGVVGWDGETSLSFHGVLVGAVIDHGDAWGVHT